MGTNTSIEWTEATWNPVRGCSRVSEGCRNCYAEAIAARFSAPELPFHGFARMTRSGPRWTGKVELVEHKLFEPVRWKEPRRIFVNSTSDLYHEKLEDPDLESVFAVAAYANWHTYQILTKRAERMFFFLTELSIRERIARKIHGLFGVRGERYVATWPLPHVWQGVSVEDQAAADKRIPILMTTPAAVRWISAEPLLGPVDLCRHFRLGLLTGISGSAYFNLLNPCPIHWLVCGGESGRGARPMDPAWARSLRDQCLAAGVQFFFKQWGEWLPAMTDGAPLSPQHINCSDAPVRVGKKVSGRLLDGREWNQYPETAGRNGEESDAHSTDSV